jgi:hypothetical protein
MSNASKRIDRQNDLHSTGDYSATKAPENREHVQSEVESSDVKLRPGGARGTPVDPGMSGLPAATNPYPDETRDPDHTRDPDDTP